MGDRDRFLAVVNPAAGGGRCGRRAGAALSRLRQAGLTVDEVRTTGPGEAVAIAARAYREGVRRFVAVGGDGTGWEVVNGIFRDPKAQADDVRLGFLPLGTGNSFLRDFSADGAAWAFDALVRGRTRRVDVLRLDHAEGTLYFINLLSTGFVARVNDLRQHRLRRLGELGYVAAVLAQVADLRASPLPMRLDDGPVEAEPFVFCSFNNSKYTGGKMMMAPRADPADGRVEVLRVRPLSRRKLLAAFPRIFRGTHVELPQVTCTRATSVTFVDPVRQPLMVDGEALTLVPQRIGVLPRALTIYA